MVAYCKKVYFGNFGRHKSKKLTIKCSSFVELVILRVSKFYVFDMLEYLIFNDFPNI